MSVPPATPPTPAPHVADFNDSIGDITMRPDGTLFCRFRVEDGQGSVGDAVLVYKPGIAAYDEVLRFIGGLKPGENKPMPRIGPRGDVPYGDAPHDK